MGKVFSAECVPGRAMPELKEIRVVHERPGRDGQGFAKGLYDAINEVNQQEYAVYQDLKSCRASHNMRWRSRCRRRNGGDEHQRWTAVHS